MKPSNTAKKSTATKMRVGSVMPGFTHVVTMGGISEYRLNKNGLTVLYKHTPGTESVTTNIVYHIGSRHEARGETGVAHMLEHMMFKPTGEGSKKDREMGWKELEDAGALMNATTWLDRTCYFFCMPTAYFSDMLETEARRMRHIILEDSEFQPERANVLSEYEMYAGRPESMLDTAVIGAAYVSHTYGHDTIGHKPDIESYTIEKLRKYYDTYYWPNNATLIVVGDVELEKVLKEVKRTFALVPRSPHAIPTTTLGEPEQTGQRKVTIERKSPINILSLNYKNVSFQHPDWLPLYFLLLYLADGKLSVLEKLLVETHKASAVQQYQFPTHDPFLCGLIVYISDGVSHEEIERILRKAIVDVQKKQIAKSDLERVRTQVKAHELFSRDGGFSEAQALTEYVAAGDWTRYHTLIRSVDTVTPKDILRVAKAYLVPERETIGMYVGKQNKKS